MSRSGDRRGPRAMTCDEVAISLLELLRAMAGNPDRDQSSRVAAAAGVAKIEAGIRLQATYWSGLGYKARLAQVASMGRDTPTYVPAVTLDGEHDGPDTPRLMARRAALWARPEILALIAAEASAPI